MEKGDHTLAGLRLKIIKLWNYIISFWSIILYGYFFRIIIFSYFTYLILILRCYNWRYFFRRSYFSSNFMKNICLSFNWQSSCRFWRWNFILTFCRCGMTFFVHFNILLRILMSLRLAGWRSRRNYAVVVVRFPCSW